ncbi:hypothetical protein [Pedobacter alpinus]|uniref:Lipocalin-like domain-containing protein n=1 Tax=Pedobacter alpinus TaxID=1590643 RepID=A0ABW5TMT9_9SPHI
MKKVILTTLSFCLMAIIISSCASKNAASTNYKVSKGTISNTWTVNNVSLEGFPAGYQIKNAFDMAPYQNFTGSIWKLYGGNSGIITLSNGTTQNIYWSLINNGTNPIFQFKKVDDGEKAREVTDGYQLNIDAASKDALTVSSPFTLPNGNTARIVYNLSAQ